MIMVVLFFPSSSSSSSSSAHHGWLLNLTKRQDEGDNLKAMGVALQKELSLGNAAKPIHSVSAGVYWYNEFFGITEHKPQILQITGEGDGRV